MLEDQLALVVNKYIYVSAYYFRASEVLQHVLSKALMVAQTISQFLHEFKVPLL
jgi:hypothetical protein